MVVFEVSDQYPVTTDTLAVITPGLSETPIHLIQFL